MLKGFLYAPVKLTPEQIHHVEEKFSESLQDQVQLVPQTDKSLIGGIRVEIDGRVYDGTIKKRLTIKDDSGDIDFASDADNFEWLEGLNTVATVEDERDEAGQIVLDSDGKPKKKRKSKLSSVDMEELEKRVRRMSGFRTRSEVLPVGYVLSVGDGIAHVSGLNGCRNNELLRFDGDKFGIAFNLERDNVGVILLDKTDDIEEGSKVEGTGRVVSVPVGESLLGRVVDPLGRPIDGREPIRAKAFRPIEAEAPPIIERGAVKTPLQTGYLAIDAMVPIGRGQRELIIGDRQTGKTAIAVDTILNQKNTGVLCIYVAIGQKASTIASVRKTLEEYGAMEYTTIVAATASDTAPMQYIAPYAGCAMAEEFMYNGKDALIIYDDLSKHAVSYRAISLLLRRPPGREAYPGDVFYLHSRLLERAAKLSDRLGGGSMTALPIIETMAGDISAYIPTNVISITDGQIFLESELFHSGVMPAVNPGISVSRVGGNAQIKAMKKVAGSLKLIYSQYRELQSFAQFGSDLDADTKARLAQGERIVAVLKQDRNSPIPVEKQVCILYAVTKDYLKDVAVEDVKEYEKGLYEYMDAHGAEVLSAIRTTGKLEEDTEKALAAALDDYTRQFLNTRAK